MNKRLIVLIILSTILLVILLNLSKPHIQKAYREYLQKKFVRMYVRTNVHRDTSWLGVPLTQNPCDMWAMQEIFYEVKPDFIIETGTYKGGSTIFFASIIQNINKNGKVITVDILDYRKPISNRKLFQDRVEFILGDSVSKEVIDKIAERIGNSSKVVVTLDSDHSKNHVLKELELYSQFVPLNSYIIVQDTHHDGWGFRKGFKEGPMSAVKEFLQTNKNFMVDRKWEKFLLTWHPSGYLKRIK